MSYTGTPYTSGLVDDKLNELGVYHARDFRVPNRSDQYSRLAALPQDVLLGVSGSDYSAEYSMDAPLSTLLTDIPNVAALEASNELDVNVASTLWRARMYQDTTRLWAAIQRQGLDALPLLGSSPAFANHVLSAADSSYLCDAENVHLYTGGVWPSASWIAQQLAYGLDNKEIWVTEFGYHVATANYQHPPVTEEEQGWLIPTMWFELFKAGAKRCYLYELVDIYATDSQENKWGLYRNDWTERPAATAIKNWLFLLDAGDPGNFGTAVQSITDPNNQLGYLEFARASGYRILVLWSTAFQTASRLITIQLPAGASRKFSRFTPATSNVAQQTVTSKNSYQVSLGNNPIMVSIAPTPT
jgi:hypothetical protein